MNFKKKIFLIILFVATIAFGYLRDYVFVFINAHINSGSSDAHFLLILKWALTVVFSLVYFIDTAVVLYLIFDSRKYAMATGVVYALLYIIALFVGLIGIIFLSFQAVYPFIRTVLGIAQSPVVLMILIPVCFLFTYRSEIK